MRPIVTVYSEVSADGKTAYRRGSSSKEIMVFEDQEVKRFRHELRAGSDAIMVGSNTIRTDDPKLTVRDAPGKSPVRVIPASKGDVSPEANIITDGGRTIIAVGAGATEQRIQELRSAGAEVLRTGGQLVDLKSLLLQLYASDIKSLMVEGGALLLSALFRARLVDRLIVQHLPVVFGGDDVPCMVGGPGLSGVDEALPLRLADVARVGGHAVITYECG